jgi:hypothetical protein
MEKWHSPAFAGTGGTFSEILMGWVGWYKKYLFDLIQQFNGRNFCLKLLKNLWILGNFQLNIMNFLNLSVGNLDVEVQNFNSKFKIVFKFKHKIS